MSLVEQPLDAVRAGVYDVMRRLAAQHGGWGVRLLCSHAGFVAWMSNTETESSKQMKEWKFAVVEAAMRHANVDSLVSEHASRMLRRVLERGPFHADVAAPSVQLAGDG